MERIACGAVVMMLLVGLASCGGDDDAAVSTADGGAGDSFSVELDDGSDENGGSIVIETDEGSAIIGSGSVPEGFPLPLFDLNVVASSSVHTDEGSLDQVTVEFAADRFDTLCDDYEAALRDLGLDVMRTSVDQGAEGRMVMLIGEGAETGAVINVMQEGGEPMGNATIGWSTEG